MKISKKISMVVLASMLAGSSLFAFGPGGHGKQDRYSDNKSYSKSDKRGGPHGGGLFFEVLASVDLTDDQQTSIDTITEEHQAALEAERNSTTPSEMRVEAIDNLIAVTADGSYNTTLAVSQNVDRATTMFTDMADYQQEIYNILTDEQKERFTEVLEALKVIKE